MRRLAISIAAAVLWSSVALAQPISRLPPAGPLSIFDLFVVDQLRPTSESTATPYGTFQVTLSDLNIFFGGNAGGGAITITVSNGSGTTIPAGAAVYISSSNTVSLALANSFTTSGVIGLAVKTVAAGALEVITTTVGTLMLATSVWDQVTGQIGGLTPNGLYFLNPSTPGHITAVPTTAPGQCNVLIGRALSSTTMLVEIEPPILL
jgi:hypothetical protein